MEVLFQSRPEKRPELSLILLDWSVRESFHILHYLREQSVPRDRYEVILIEYYGRRSEEIDRAMAGARASGEHLPLDTWAVMGMPESTYYHKHLMYNVGIVLSRGRIVSLMDSDAVVSHTFVENILSSFEKDRGIVLHLDQLRNYNRRFYPFNFPSVREIETEGPTNALAGRPEGLLDSLDPLRTRNYGACMCALRRDMIAAGGADEHIDYLGHVCGPYDLTLRLANAGKREVWHQGEWLYHTWHPGQAGGGNYVGPNDGRNVSTTALDVRRTGRVMPLVENPAIMKLRTEPGSDLPHEGLLGLALSEVDPGAWDSEKLDKSFQPASGSKANFSYIINHPITYMKLAFPILSICLSQLKGTKLAASQAPGSRSPCSLPLLKNALSMTINYSGYVIYRSRQCLEALASEGSTEIALYGSGDVARIFCIVCGEFPVNITAVYGEGPGGGTLPTDSIGSYGGKLVVAENIKVGDDTVKRLRDAGVSTDNMVLLI